MPDGKKAAFKQKVSEYLKHLLARIRSEYGEKSPEYDAIYNQYFYSPLEDMVEQEHNLKHYEAALTSKGGLPRGLERLYKRQLVIDLTMVCAAHCRYCLRSNYDPVRIKRSDIAGIVAYIASDEYLKELLVTGGDPLMVPHLLMQLISEVVQKAPNIQIIRIGTRLPVQSPDKFDEELFNFFKSYQESVSFECAIQINHAIELQEQPRKIIEDLQKSGVRIYSQNVLLKNVNDKITALVELYDHLRYLGVEAHYLFHPVPLIGTHHFRPSIAKALSLIKELTSSGRISGRIKPMLSLMTDVGKVTLYEGTLGAKDEQGYLDIQTNYQIEDRLRWNPDYLLPDSARVDEWGHIIVKYLDGSDD
ncbi:radical SAM protein [Phosphitispora fastidiosa]|uniref:radical SAM protein n=1 Tax=Phosphitispora fastidiosa TaxID=2837202 RepID=UPI001E47FB4F|nr:radical SAM protein [Phosphitispora fastidiosa]MBU7008489.1 lysine 2 [Phosphitispora fastidiosa]